MCTSMAVEREKKENTKKRGGNQSDLGKRVNLLSAEGLFCESEIFVGFEMSGRGTNRKIWRDSTSSVFFGKPMGAVSVFMCRISLTQPSNTLQKEIEIRRKRKEKNPETGDLVGPEERGRKGKP